MSDDKTTYTTFDTARKCPKCNNYGEVIKEQQGSRRFPGSKVYTIRCENKLCTWADTTWIVEVDAEGRVPVRDTGHVPKRFVSREKTGVVDPAKMKAYMDRIRGEEEVSRRGRELPNE